MKTDLTLPEDEIHVWSIDLLQPLSGPRTRALTAVLHGDERDRADCFHFARDREAFVRSRAALRILAGRYLNIPASEINFSILERGKPELVPADNLLELQFNVSHTRGMAVVAFVRNHPVGIDIETCQRPLTDADAIARRFFTARESRSLAALNADERRLAFFRIWTQKEAYLKATGEGISSSLNKIEVAVHKDVPFGISEIHGSSEAARSWNSWRLDLPFPYIGSVMIQGPKFPLRQMPFQFGETA